MSALIGFIAESVAGIVLNEIKGTATDKINRNRLELEIQRALDEKKNTYHLEEVKESKLFQAITDSFWNDHTELVFQAITGTESERKTARANLYEITYKAADAKNTQEKRTVHDLVSEILHLSRKYYRDLMSDSTKFMTAEITEEIIHHTDDRLNNLEDQITSLYTSPINLNILNELAENRDIEGLKKASESVKEYMEKAHILYPDYGIEIDDQGNLSSKPLSKEAEKKYPPVVRFKGVVSIGDEIMPALTPELVDYANRHQQRININITDARQFLGNIEDPFQFEAENLIGETLVKEPDPFQPAQPYCIKIDNTIVYDYIELRLVEVLDDGSLVISNREQKDSPLDFTINVNTSSNQNSFLFGAKERSNRKYLKFLRFMKASMNGSKVTVYSLKEETPLIEGYCRDLDVKKAPEVLDKEIEFFSWICQIEDFFTINIELPEAITQWEHHIIEKICTMINGENYVNKGDRFNLHMTLHEGSKDAIWDTEDSDMIIWMDMIENVTVFGYTFSLPIRRTLAPVRIVNLDKLKKVIEYMDVGDDVTIKLSLRDGKCSDQITKVPTVSRIKS